MTASGSRLSYMLDDAAQETLLRDLPVGSKLSFDAQTPGFTMLTIEDKQKSFSYGFQLGANGYCKFESAQMKTRGTNLSAIVMRNIVEIVPELGVRSIEIYAAEIGAYLWGRAGFAPHQSEWQRMVPRLQKRLDYLVSVNGSAIAGAAETMRKDLMRADPKTLWKIADCKETLDDGSTLGKAILLAWSPENFPDAKALTDDVPKDLSDVVSWRGKLDLQDSPSDDRLYDYIESASHMAERHDDVVTVSVAAGKPVLKP